MNTVETAFLALHDLSLDVSGAVTPDRVAAWAEQAMRRLDPEIRTAVWWRLGDENQLIHGEPPEGIRLLPPATPEHLCLMHHRRLIDASFFGLTTPGWHFVPITDRKVLYGWIGLETDAATVEVMLPVLCTMGAMLGQFVRRQQMEDERVAAERSQAILRRYLSPEMAKAVTGGDFHERFVQDASVLILDLRSFTERIFTQEPRSLLNELNAFFEEAVQCVFAHEGIVDKLLGDGLLAHFGVLPNEPPHPARRAVDAALALLEKTRCFNEACRPCKPFTIGIGIATGQLHVGNVGGKDFFDLTVIGQPVNLAARLQAETKALDCDIVIDAKTFEGLQSQEGWRPYANRTIRGVPTLCDIYARNST